MAKTTTGAGNTFLFTCKLTNLCEYYKFKNVVRTLSYQ
jgi:hypothetical protein